MTEFLQSDSWKVFQEALGRNTHVQSGSGWHFLAVHEHTKFGLRIYTPGGPIATSVGALTEALDSLEMYARSVGAYVMRIEPDVLDGIDYEEALKGLRYRKAHRNINPGRSVENDVASPIETIDAASSPRVRRAWRKNEKAGVTFSVSHEPSDITIFLDMIHDVAKRTDMKPHSDLYFRKMAESLFPLGAAGLLIASYENKPIATILYFDDGETMLYAHAASYTEMRELSPATALGLFALHYAHESGRKTFDFFGIAPENAPDSHPWQGFTKFKLGFGGTPAERSGAWEFTFDTIKYNMYRSLVDGFDFVTGVSRKK